MRYECGPRLELDVQVNFAALGMTRGERWYHGLWELVYRIRPAWLGGCRGIQVVPFLEAAGFRVSSREYVSQFGFSSEVVRAIKTA